MRVKTVFLAVFIFTAMSIARPSQSESKQEESQSQESRQESSSKPAPKRPSLGPAPPPSLSEAPKTANTLNPRKLIRVKKIYVERMDNNLHEKLMAALTATKRFEIVSDLGEADAVLRGTCLDMRRLSTLRSEVYLNEVHGAAIWQDNVRRPINPPAIKAAVEEAAQKIATDLAESLTHAELH